MPVFWLPRDYPDEVETIIASGCYDTCEEDGYMYCRLEDGSMNWQKNGNKMLT